MSPRPKQFVAVLTAYFLLAAGSSVFAADTLVMPRELVDFAHASGCEQIDYYYDGLTSLLLLSGKIGLHLSSHFPSP